jgi:hypothetical protein
MGPMKRNTSIGLVLIGLGASALVGGITSLVVGSKQ